MKHTFCMAIAPKRWFQSSSAALHQTFNRHAEEPLFPLKLQFCYIAGETYLVYLSKPIKYNKVWTD